MYLERLSKDDVQRRDVKLLALDDVPERQTLPGLLRVGRQQHIGAAAAADGRRLLRWGHLPSSDGGRCAHTLSRIYARGQQPDCAAAFLQAAAPRNVDALEVHGSQLPWHDRSWTNGKRMQAVLTEKSAVRGCRQVAAPSRCLYMRGLGVFSFSAWSQTLGANEFSNLPSANRDFDGPPVTLPLSQSRTAFPSRKPSETIV